MSRTSFCLSILSLVLASGAAYAQERSPLLQHKSWEVDLAVDSETGYRSCRASKVAHSGDVLRLETDEDGTEFLIIALSDAHWPEDFIGDLKLDIDDEEWTLEGADFYMWPSDGISLVLFDFPEGTAFQEFMNDLTGGSSVSLMDEPRHRSLFTWSLEGSSAALSKLEDCYGIIRDANHQPRVENKKQLNSSRG